MQRSAAHYKTSAKRVYTIPRVFSTLTALGPFVKHQGHPRVLTEKMFCFKKNKKLEWAVERPSKMLHC